MLIIQNIYRSPSPRTFATKNTRGKETGLTKGKKIDIYANGDILFYSHNHILPESAGFVKIAVRKVCFTQNRIQVSMPPKWVAEYCNNLTHVRAYYTDIGLFIRPFYGGNE